MGTFVFIVPTDLHGNRLNEMTIRRSVFFLFFFFQQNRLKVMQINELLKNRIDVLMATVILIVLSLMLYYKRRIICFINNVYVMKYFQQYNINHSVNRVYLKTMCKQSIIDEISLIIIMHL